MFPEADGKVGWTDRLPDRLTFVSQRQSAVEVAFLHHPRCIVGLAGDPAGTRAAHPNRCKKWGRCEPQPAAGLGPSLPPAQGSKLGWQHPGARQPHPAGP